MLIHSHISVTTAAISCVPFSKIPIILELIKKQTTNQELCPVFMAEMNEAYLHEIQLYIDKRHKSSVHTPVSNSRWNHRYGWHNGAKGQWMCDLLTKGIQTDKNVSAGEQQCQMFNRTELFYRCLSVQVWIIQHFQVFFSLVKLFISPKDCLF